MRRRERRALRKPSAELNITAFLNLMVVLVPFLLITAVFSRITILELDVPTGSQTQNSSQQQQNLEVIVRKTGITVSDNRGAISQIKDYNLQTLSGIMQKIKQKVPAKTDVTLLLEPDIPYDVLVQVMDVVRIANVEKDESVDKLELFPDISIGDAPRARNKH